MKNNLLILVIPFAVLLLHAFYYYPFFADDTFISLRYADRFIHGHGLTWNDGEYVEGYSNLLFVLLASALGYIGFHLDAAARAIGVVSSLFTMLAFARYQRRFIPGNSTVLGLANLTFALTAPVAIWAIGGLEAALTTALLAWTYVLAVELLEIPEKLPAILCGILLGLVCLNRPEGPFFTIAAALGLWLFAAYARQRLIPQLAILCGVPFAFFCAQLIFRLCYYGDWLPNTFYVKVAFTWSRLLNGLLYCLKGLASFLPLLLIIALKADALVKNPYYVQQKRRAAFLATVSVLWIALLIIGGGDIFPGYRHLLPIYPALLMVMMDCLAIIYDRGEARSTHVFFLYVLACFFWLQCNFEENNRARHEQWVWDTKDLADMLRTRYGDTQPVVAVTLAGIIPFYSGLPSIDMYGLNDRYIAHHRSEDSGYGSFGHGFIGHELYNGKYILSRKPDIIIFHTGRKPAQGIDVHTAPLYGIDKLPGFSAYEPRLIRLPSYDAEIWVRKDSRKVQDR